MITNTSPVVDPVAETVLARSQALVDGRFRARLLLTSNAECELQLSVGGPQAAGFIFYQYPGTVSLDLGVIDLPGGSEISVNVAVGFTGKAQACFSLEPLP